MKIHKTKNIYNYTILVCILFSILILFSYFTESRKEGFSTINNDKSQKSKESNEKTNNNEIPKTIYMCDKNLKHIKKYSQNWKKLNPDYEIKLYDNEMCKNFLLEEYSKKHYDIFNFIKDGPIKADFWRCCILYKYGGLYVDADIEPLKPLDFIPKDVDFVTCLSQFSNHLFNPHFIMSKPKEPILKDCIDKYLYFYENNKIYTYWGWSIVTILDNIMTFMYPLKIKKDGVYSIGNKKYLFMKEVYGKNYRDNHCVYENKRVLNNRYENYDYQNHTFV